MNLKELKLWFAEDPTRWDALSSFTQKRLARCSPIPAEKAPKEHKRPGRRSPHENSLNDILKLADGSRTISEIAAELAIERKAVVLSAATLHRRGENPQFKSPAGRPRSKITRDLEREIIQAVKRGETQADVAKQFNITRSYVSLMVKRSNA